MRHHSRSTQIILIFAFSACFVSPSVAQASVTRIGKLVEKENRTDVVVADWCDSKSDEIVTRVKDGLVIGDDGLTVGFRDHQKANDFCLSDEIVLKGDASANEIIDWQLKDCTDFNARTGSHYQSALVKRTFSFSSVAKKQTFQISERQWVISPSSAQGFQALVQSSLRDPATFVSGITAFASANQKPNADGCRWYLYKDASPR